MVAGKSADLPCDQDSYGLYCGDTIYLDAQIDLDGYRENPDAATGWMAFVLAHEYGHHVQALTGMAEASYRRGLKLNGVELALEETRRYELQASCFAGVFLGADAAGFRKYPGWPDEFRAMLGSMRDPDYDHGSTKNQARWTLAGFRAADPVACNTFAAPATAVG